jgi:hypothetical protein
MKAGVINITEKWDVIGGRSRFEIYCYVDISRDDYAATKVTHDVLVTVLMPREIEAAIEEAMLAVLGYEAEE